MFVVPLAVCDGLKLKEGCAEWRFCSGANAAVTMLLVPTADDVGIVTWPEGRLMLGGGMARRCWRKDGMGACRRCAGSC